MTARPRHHSGTPRFILGDDRRLARYGAAVASVGAAWAIRELVLPPLVDRGPFVVFGLAVLVPAVVGGLGPGLLATGLSSILALLFYLPPYAALAVHAPVDVVLLGLFVLEALVAAVVGALVRRGLMHSHATPTTDALAQFLRRAESVRGAERRAERRIEVLTPRELEVARLLAFGASNDEIAEALVLSTNTIKTHLKRIYGKLGAGTRTEAVARLIELELLGGPVEPANPAPTRGP